jgi:hypothetical protein
MNAMRARDQEIEVVFALCEEDISQENLSYALAAHAALAGFLDSDLPFAVAE